MNEKITSFIMLLLSCTLPLFAGEQSKKFAHIRFPKEINAVAQTSHNAFAKGDREVYRINKSDWSIEKVFDLDGKSLFTQVQTLAANGEDVYWYVNGEGIYHMPWNGTAPTLKLPKSDSWCAHNEEMYGRMNIDPTGRYLVLFGWKENAVVFDIAQGLKPVASFNDYVRDAYWIADNLWAGCIDDKVVINSRKGKSINNQDFIKYGTNDQTGMFKLYVSNPKILPNMGEVEQSLDEAGELVRFLYNKGNGDLLMCVSSRYGTKIFKVNNYSNPEIIVHTAEEFHDFTALNNKIFARQAYKFAEIPYGATTATDLNLHKIQTDILKPKAWPGDKPKPYVIDSSNFMEYDKDGNLWIIADNWGFKELFVIFKDTAI